VGTYRSSEGGGAQEIKTHLPSRYCKSVDEVPPLSRLDRTGECNVSALKGGCLHLASHAFITELTLALSATQRPFPTDPMPTAREQIWGACSDRYLHSQACFKSSPGIPSVCHVYEYELIRRRAIIVFIL